MELRKLTDCLRRFRARSSLSGVGDACETLRLSISQGILWFEVSSGYIYQGRNATENSRLEEGWRGALFFFSFFFFLFVFFFFTAVMTCDEQAMMGRKNGNDGQALERGERV